MATNSYTGKTAFETFQTLNYGDRIWPDVELQNWQRVENRLLSFSLDNYVINHGTFAYDVNPLDPTDVHVTLSPNGLNSAFVGTINGCYFRIDTVMTWQMSITVDGTYYLYLKGITGQTDPTSDASLEKEYTTTEYTGSDLKTRIIMAVVTRTGGVLQTIDHDPAGQMTSQMIYDHLYDSSDPHGTTLTQTNFVVSNATAGTAFATAFSAVNANITGLTAVNEYVSSLTAANMFSGTANFDNLNAVTANIGTLNATSVGIQTLTGTTGFIGALNATSVNASSVTGITGYFDYISGPTASFDYSTGASAYIGTLTVGTASASYATATTGYFNHIFIRGTTSYMEHIYEQNFTANSTAEFNLNTQIGITGMTAEPMFISSSPLSVCQTGFFYKYSGLSGETNRYVVYNPNSTGITGRMFIKYKVV